MGQLSHPSAIRIRAMVDLAPGQNRDVCERFSSFVKTYRREMLTRISESLHPNWELIVALRPDIRNGGRPHIVIVGHLGRLMIRVTEIPANADFMSDGVMKSAADESARMIKHWDPESAVSGPSHREP